MRYNPIYHTPQWEKMRKAILYRDGYQCRQCKRYGKNIPANTVHHIIPGNMDLFYVTDNMISLCEDCHDHMHNRFTCTLTESGEMWKNRLIRNRPDLTPKEIYVNPKVVIVSGCMGSGKTTYVKNNKQPNDIVFDYDRILNALMLNDIPIHYHNKQHIDIMLSMREHFFTLVEAEKGNWKTAWIITTLKNNKLQKLIERFKAKHININSTKEECINNILRDDTRPDKEKEIELIKKYFS